MREIKFRVWNKELKEMHYPDQLTFREHKQKLYVVSMWKVDKQLRGYSPDLIPYLIPLQYTGLKDKNGKEIYEGDIIKWLIFPERKEPIFIIDSVSFGIGCYKVEKRCEILGLKEPYRKLEVIGNIYENPELLRKEK